MQEPGVTELEDAGVCQQKVVWPEIPPGLKHDRVKSLDRITKNALYHQKKTYLTQVEGDVATPLTISK